MIKNKHYLTVKKTARFYTFGELNKRTEYIWFVLHGYGQLANYFIDKFKALSPGKHFIVAPEALNRFYLKGFSGRIGATWMTKEERTYEITDYVNYLNSVYERIVDGIENQVVKINLLGFSQGAHTAVRWFLNSQVKVNNLILWSGSFPENNEITDRIKKLNSTNIFLVIGDRDEFIDEKSILIERERLKSLKLNYKLIPFNGGHEIEKDTLIELSKIL